jgi:hypothetical protein
VIRALLAPEKGAFSGVRFLVYAGRMPNDRSPVTVLFSSLAVLALPDQVTDCEGAALKGNRDAEGRPQVLCTFYPGEVAQPLPRGGPLRSALVLSPSDARALARELERSAEEAEEQ